MSGNFGGTFAGRKSGLTIIQYIGEIMKKLFKVLFKAWLVLVVVIIAFLFVYVHKDEWASKKKIDGIEAYATSVSELKLPDDVKVISLGEATHGNKEFQLLKQIVFEKLIEKYDVKTFVLEMDMGEGAYVNDYIKNESDYTIDEIMSLISFEIYHTEEIKNMIEMMRDYNSDHNNELSFYGFDLQNPNMAVSYLIEQDIGLDETMLQPIAQNDISLSDEDVQESIAYIKDIDDAKLEENYQLLIQNIINAFEFYETADMNDYVATNTLRDSYMADSVLAIAEVSETPIMISGHNGHIAKSNVMYTSMGCMLNDALGDGYYAIGTDYFYSDCNLPSGGERVTHKFCSADILAYQAKYMESGEYLLDFELAAENEDLKELLNSYKNAGDIGENYSFIMSILPSSTRKKQVFTNLYDAMIFEYEAMPIEIQ